MLKMDKKYVVFKMVNVGEDIMVIYIINYYYFIIITIIVFLL